MSNIADRMAGTQWGIDAVGWGQRGAGNPEVTYRFEGKNAISDSTSMLTNSMKRR